MENRVRRPVISRRNVVVGVLLLGAPGLALAASDVRTITAEDGRRVSLTVWPAAGRERGTILFSHGALSAPDKYQRLAGPWAQAGFRVLAPLHVDSTLHPDHAKFGLVDGWRARILDMRATARFAASRRYVAAGHSYGGLVALTLGGAQAVAPEGLTEPLRDPDAVAVVAFSPPGTQPGLITSDTYAHLSVPAFIETGTADMPPGAADYRSHLVPFEQAPSGDKYAVVLPDVDHYFGGLICRLDRPGPPQSAQLERAVGLSTEFVRAFASQNGDARRSLDAAFAANTGAQFMRK